MPVPKLEPVRRQAQVVPERAQVADDVGAVAEQVREELDVRQPQGQALRGVPHAVERVHDVRADQHRQQARHHDRRRQAEQQATAGQHGRDQHALDPVGGARDVDGRAGLRETGPRRRAGEQQVDAAERQRQVDQQHRDDLHRRVGRAPARPAAAGPGDAVVDRAAPSGCPVPALAVRNDLPRVQRRRVPQLGAVAHRRVDVDHRGLADEHVRAERDRSGPDQAALRPVAGDQRVLADHGAVADRQQVRADRHRAGQERDPAPDPRAEHPQVEPQQRGPGRDQHQRVRADQRAHHPEPQVCRAPEADLAGRPAADQQPLRRDRQQAHRGERDRPDGDRAQVVPDEPVPARDPAVGLGGEHGQRVGVRQEQQELGEPAEQVVAGARRCGRDGRGGGCRRGGRRGRRRGGPGGPGARGGRGGHRRRGQPRPASASRRRPSWTPTAGPSTCAPARRSGPSASSRRPGRRRSGRSAARRRARAGGRAPR